jgi:hypothetical protein
MGKVQLIRIILEASEYGHCVLRHGIVRISQFDVHLVLIALKWDDLFVFSIGSDWHDHFSCHVWDCVDISKQGHVNIFLQKLFLSLIPR